MKNLVLVFTILLASQLHAKKVKFAVDMTGQTISPNGVHVAGDFQTLAGYAGGDFNAATTTLTPEQNDTNIYSVVVNIPAMAKYEYRFVNGDQFYESEFVPEKSRVGYEFNDNRWIYVDSTANDTTFIGAIIFGGNASAGKMMLRALVDVQNVSNIDSQFGIRIAGNFVQLPSAYSRLYSFVTNIYEAIYFVNAGTQNFLFYNGLNSEIVSGACTNNGMREINVNTDTILSSVCFSSCGACLTSGIANNKSSSSLNVFPNPAKDFVNIRFGDKSTQHTLYIYDVTGKSVEIFEVFNQNNFQVNCRMLPKGMYELFVKDENNNVAHSKLAKTIIGNA